MKVVVLIVYMASVDFHSFLWNQANFQCNFKLCYVFKVVRHLINNLHSSTFHNSVLKCAKTVNFGFKTTKTNSRSRGTVFLVFTLSQFIVCHFFKIVAQQILYPTKSWFWHWTFLTKDCHESNQILRNTAKFGNHKIEAVDCRHACLQFFQ